MSNNLDLRDIDTLYNLQKALNKFSEGATASIQSAEKVISHTLDWLQDRINYWQREIRKTQEDLEQALRDLRKCEASGYYDKNGRYIEPNCGEEKVRVYKLRRQLQEYQKNLETTRIWRSKVDQASYEFMREASRLSDLAGRHTIKAVASLTRTAAKYESVHPSSSHRMHDDLQEKFDVNNFPASALGISPHTITQSDFHEFIKAKGFPADAIGIGPYAKGSYPPHSSGHNYFWIDERNAMDNLGYTFGCHTCGSKDPGTKSGHFIPDHQPPTSIWADGVQVLYPQCLSCSQRQFFQLRDILRKLFQVKL